VRFRAAPSESVIPYLETNRLRPLFFIKLPIAYQIAKVLGQSAFLLYKRSGLDTIIRNAEVAFPSSSYLITRAANLPTPATAAIAANGALQILLLLASS
jgi:hypothetical protein